MRSLVTGAAGFIGSHLCETLLAAGHEVVGLDAFIPYYPRAIKEANLAGLRADPHFTFYELDLRTDDLAPALEGVDTVFHLAAMGGLVLSWTHFDLYMTCNIQATERLLAAIRQTGKVDKFIYASTSSIYGSDVTGPETATPHPVSPYGITKLAGEHLVQAYDRQFGIPVHDPALLLGVRPAPASRHGLLHFHGRDPARQADYSVRRRQPTARQHLRHRHSPRHSPRPRQVRAQRDIQPGRRGRSERKPGDRPPAKRSSASAQRCNTPPPAPASKAARWPTPHSPSNASALSPDVPARGLGEQVRWQTGLSS